MIIHTTAHFASFFFKNFSFFSTPTARCVSPLLSTGYGTLFEVLALSGRKDSGGCRLVGRGKEAWLG
jgi:hypothetical protein